MYLCRFMVCILASCKLQYELLGRLRLSNLTGLRHISSKVDGKTIIQKSEMLSVVCSLHLPLSDEDIQVLKM